ncbi:MAG: serine/threonine-protein kinase [Gemmatimonadaceae bacterium]|nr:serine/threonine-protein kinase [Gemmatimonadaceae bacterium]
MAELRDQLQKTLGGSYAFERELGGGGMSRVFVAEETALGRKVVIKVLPPDLAATVNVERFRREIQLAAQLQHPHIVPLFSAGIADGLPYYTMPLVEGDSLRTRLIRHGELPIPDALKILRDMASALSYAHDHGVVHRDIKPENVMLTKHHALIMDFGVAKALSAATNPGNSLTSMGVALGTPAYMSPEQATADPHTDHRADIYALGAVAYEMLTGRQLFGDRSPQAMLRAHAIEKPDPIEVRRASAPPALSALVMRMLEKSPADRPQTAEDVLRTLDTFVLTPTGMTPTATVPMQATTAVHPAAGESTIQVFERTWAPRKSRTLVAAALVGAGILAAGGMMAKGRFGSAELDIGRVVVPPFTNRTGDRNFDNLGVLATDWVTRGLTEANISDVAVVDSLNELASKSDGGLSDVKLQQIALAAGAGRIIRGEIHRRGDSLEFQVVVLDTRSGTRIANVQPSASPVASPMGGIDGIRQRVMGSMATLANRRTTGLAVSDVPPSYEAYTEFMRGEDEFLRYRYAQAIVHYARAAEMDPSYAAPLVRAAYAHANLIQLAQADSVIELLEQGTRRLSEYERIYLARAKARVTGNYNDAYRAGQRLKALAPTSSFAQYIAAEAAIPVNRLREAKAGLEELWPNKYPTNFYYGNLSIVYHVLEDTRDEKRTVEKWAEAFPDVPQQLAGQVWYNARKGSPEAVQRVFQELLTRHNLPEFNSTALIGSLVAELRFHGRPDEAEAMTSELLDWLQRRPAAERRAAWNRRSVAYVLADLGRCAEARRLSDSLAVSDSTVIGMTQAGIIAARCGDNARADSLSTVLGDLERPYQRGDNVMGRARIAAAQGKKREAVQFLLDALAQGQTYATHFHQFREFATLRDFEPFKAAMRSKD